MQCNIRKWVAADYEVVNPWWKDHWGHDVPSRILPPTGFVAEIEGKQAGAGFLMVGEGFPVCMIEYVVTDPELGGIARARAVKEILKASVQAAVELRGPDVVIYTVSPHPGYHRLLEASGFQIGEKAMTSYVWSTALSDVATFKESK